MSSSEDSASAELGRGNPAHGAEGNRPRNSPSGGADFDAVKEAALKGAKKKHLHAVVVLPDKEVRTDRSRV